jgi:CRP/FNR family cyclic AMP-dependent transcriptional regulator
VRMIKTLAGRLERANQQIELLLLPNANHRVVQCLRLMADEQLAAAGGGADSQVYLPVDLAGLATRVALQPYEVEEILGRLAQAQLVTTAADVGIDGPGYVIPEVGRLLEFLEFLELRDRYGGF